MKDRQGNSLNCLLKSINDFIFPLFVSGFPPDIYCFSLGQLRLRVGSEEKNPTINNFLSSRLVLCEAASPHAESIDTDSFLMISSHSQSVK